MEKSITVHFFLIFERKKEGLGLGGIATFEIFSFLEIFLSDFQYFKPPYTHTEKIDFGALYC
jgi:hypothetical protein